MSSSNLVVKMMSGEDLPDDNTSKGFRLVEAYGEVVCERMDDNSPLIKIPLENGPTVHYHPEGNTYVMKNGKTVATFAFAVTKSSFVTELKAVGKAIKVNIDKQTKFTQPEYTWCTQPDHLSLPKSKNDKFVILKDLVHELALSPHFEKMESMGWGKIDDFINVESRAKFLVYAYDGSGHLPHLPYRSFKEIFSQRELDAIDRIPCWDKPRIILLNSRLTEYPKGYRKFRATTGDIECFEFGIYQPQVTYIDGSSNEVSVEGVVEKVVTLRTADELKDFIKRLKLGKENPFFNVNAPRDETPRVNELLASPELSSYQLSCGGLYYYVGLTDNIATERVEDISKIANNFVIGIPHSFIFDAADIINVTEYAAVVRSLQNVLDYRYTGRTRINTNNGRYLIEMARPDVDPDDSVISLDESSPTKTITGIIENTSDMMLLRALPNKFKPKVILKIFIRALTQDDQDYFFAHYKEVDGGYKLYDFG